MGTSSILAATILAAIAGVKGWSFDPESLVHLVLMVEQMLTTGGGWQDQVGGIFPGIKVLPRLCVVVCFSDCSPCGHVRLLSRLHPCLCE
jgi:hypothetical protein